MHAQKDNGLRVGPYELLTRLASGGMGEIFIARRTAQGDFEKKVALKLLLPHLVPDHEFVQRFFDEARLAARMNHPNIVQIFDVGESDGRPYLAMALVEGISLARLIKLMRAQQVMLPMPIVRLIATGLCEALTYAHTLKGTRGEELNVIHRDVTPSNVLLSRDGAVMLNDFGIAKAAINEHQTRPGTVRGKYAYLAPEQAHRGQLTPRADIFSAAVTLYETLTLSSPFFHPGDVQTMEAVLKHVPPSAATLRHEVSERMTLALEKALQKDPERRFGTARQLRERFVDGEVASPHELGDLIQTWAKEDLRVFEKGYVAPEGDAQRGTQSLQVQVPISGPTPLVPRPAKPRARASAALIVLVAAAAGFATVMYFRPVPPPAVIPLPPPPPPTPEPNEISAVEPTPTPPEPTPEPAVPEPPMERVVIGPDNKPVVVKRLMKLSAPEKPKPAADIVRVGYLSADAEPWATVLLDGKEVDRTPLSRFPVPIGKHTLVFRSASGAEESRPLSIEEGKVATVRVLFQQTR